MASQSELYSPQTIIIGPEQIGNDPLGVPEDVQQLRLDAMCVLEGKVDINTFEPEYQEKIKNYYKYAGRRYGSRYGLVAQRTRHTLDIV
jgi:hypothetical protein